MSLCILSGDASISRRRRQAGVHSDVYIATGRVRELISEQDAYWSEGLITPTTGELLWICLSLDQLHAYLDIRPGTVRNVSIFCDNVLAIDCVLLGPDAAVGYDAYHLCPLAQLCHERVTRLRNRGCQLRSALRPRRGRHSRLVESADARARQAREACWPLLSTADLRDALRAASDVLHALRQEDRDFMLDHF